MGGPKSDFFAFDIGGGREEELGGVERGGEGREEAGKTTSEGVRIAGGGTVAGTARRAFR